LLANTASGVGPFACKQASHSGSVAHSVGDQLAGEYRLRRCPIRLQASFPQRLRGTLCGRPACWRIRPPTLAHSLASKLPTVASWHTLWETSLLANSDLRRCPIRLQASFPQRLRGTLCGRPACWRIPPPALPHSLASKLPTAASWHTLWEPACWRRFHPPTTSRWQTHAPRRTPVDPPGPGPAD
jgi:hypothetical protein